MSNLEYVAELCGTDSVGWICEQLAGDLDQRDNEIAKLKELLAEVLPELNDYEASVFDDEQVSELLNLIGRVSEAAK